MAPSDSFPSLMVRLEAGDPEAATLVHDRYARRLIGLALKALPGWLQAKVGPEDIAQSVFRTFFRRAADRCFDLASEDALWALLAELPLRKCGRWSRHFSARKRTPGREASLSPGDESSLFEPADAR